MAVSSYRASASAEISENPLGRLTSKSPCIQSWHDDLQTFFFKEDGILVAQPGGVRKSVVFPYLVVSFNLRSLDNRDSLESILLFIQSYQLNDEQTFNNWKALSLSNIHKIKQGFQVWNRNENINIFKKIIVDRKKYDGLKWTYKTIEGTYKNIDKSHCLQLMTSLIYLYKDIVASSRCRVEENKLLMLKELLELLPKTDDGEGDCKALKEMMLILKEEEMSLDDSLVDQEEEVPMHYIITHIYEVIDINYNMGFFNIDKLRSLIKHLSSKDFVCLVVNKGNILPKIILKNALKKRSKSVLAQIMVQNPMLLLKHLPLSLVQKVLKKMLKDDFIILFETMSIEMLINILTKIPRDLLKKVLLEIPKEVLNKLNLKISPISLREEIDQYIAELTTTYQFRQGTLEVSERKVPSLRFLAVSKICQASIRCLVGNGALSLSSTYIKQMERLYPDLQQEEVCSLVRLMVNIPVIDGMPQFAFEGSQEKDYLPELDLLPLASMAPGYDDFIRKTLLEKCGNNLS